MNRQFTKGDITLLNKHKKMCSLAVGKHKMITFLTQLAKNKNKKIKRLAIYNIELGVKKWALKHF